MEALVEPLTGGKVHCLFMKKWFGKRARYKADALLTIATQKYSSQINNEFLRNIFDRDFVALQPAPSTLHWAQRYEYQLEFAHCIC
jgi:hypothetical protein